MSVNTWNLLSLTGKHSLLVSISCDNLNRFLRTLLILHWNQAVHHPYSVSIEYFKIIKSYDNPTKMTISPEYTMSFLQPVTGFIFMNCKHSIFISLNNSYSCWGCQKIYCKHCFPNTSNKFHKNWEKNLSQKSRIATSALFSTKISPQEIK